MAYRFYTDRDEQPIRREVAEDGLLGFQEVMLANGSWAPWAVEHAREITREEAEELAREWTGADDVDLEGATEFGGPEQPEDDYPSSGAVLGRGDG